MTRTIVHHESRALLTRLLSDAALVEGVRALPNESFGALVRHVGLEDAGEIVALATNEQLVALLDEDLWQPSEGGIDEALDAARFALWLEVLLEAGEAAAARRLSELPEELLLAGFSASVVVIDMDELAIEFAQLREDDADMIDKALEDALHQEIGGYRVVSRGKDGWDAIVRILLALDERHHPLLERLLERLAAASRTEIDDRGGLYDALNDAEMLASDAAASREDRRAEVGYVSAASAKSFLSLAKQPLADAAAVERDAITRAYFRELGPRVVVAPKKEALPLLALLGQVSGSAPDMLALGSGKRGKKKQGGDVGLLREAMSELIHADRAAHDARMEELAYLVNVLVAAAAAKGETIRPVDAAGRVVSIVERGLELSLAQRKPKTGSSKPGQVLAVCPCDWLFRRGYQSLGD